MTRFLTIGLRAALSAGTILATAAVVATPAAAQTTTGQVRGQVTDAAGAPVAGAQVVAVNTGTNQTFRSTTNANGQYDLKRPAPRPVPRDRHGRRRPGVRTGRDGSDRPDRHAQRRARRCPRSRRRKRSIDGQGHRRHRQPPDRNADQRSRDQRQPHANRSLPQTDRNFLSLRRARAGRALQRQRDRQGHSARAHRPRARSTCSSTASA